MNAGSYYQVPDTVCALAAESPTLLLMQCIDRGGFRTLCKFEKQNCGSWPGTISIIFGDPGTLRNFKIKTRHIQCTQLQFPWFSNFSASPRIDSGSIRQYKISQQDLEFRIRPCMVHMSAIQRCHAAAPRPLNPEGRVEDLFGTHMAIFCVRADRTMIQKAPAHPRRPQC